MAPRENPIFAQIKHLMTTVKTQLADFTRYQQKQRQGIASCSTGAQGSENTSSSQWTSETKHKLLELANQQKELLKLFQHHKKLLERMQALKQRAKSFNKHIIPAVEVHSNSNRGFNAWKEIIDQSTRPSLPSTASNMSPLAVTTCTKIIPNSGSKQGGEQLLNKHTSITLEKDCSSCVPSTHRSSAVSQQMTLVDQPVLNSHTPIPMSHNATSVTQSLVTTSVISQPRVQNVVLTGGQLYQVGDKQVYVLPQGLITRSVTSSLGVTQAAQTHQVQAAKPSFTTTSTAVTNRASVTQERGLFPSSSLTASTQGPTLNTVHALPLTALSWQDQKTQTTSQLPISNTAISSSRSTLPISATIPFSNTSLPVSTARSVSNSSVLENRTLPNGSEISSKQATNVNQSDPVSHTTLPESTSTMMHMQKSTMVQPQRTTPSKNTSGIQSSAQPAKMTATIASKGPVSNI